MSSRVRRMALGLATLTLLTSLFMVVQGVLNAPEALASCPERIWCEHTSGWYDIGTCCCWLQEWRQRRDVTCYWQEVDCTINYYYTHDYACFSGPGYDCSCPIQ